jgi:hypothetical protein
MGRSGEIDITGSTNQLFLSSSKLGDITGNCNLLQSIGHTSTIIVGGELLLGLIVGQRTSNKMSLHLVAASNAASPDSSSSDASLPATTNSPHGSHLSSPSWRHFCG